jgi:hypothetical protein
VGSVDRPQDPSPTRYVIEHRRGNYKAWSRTGTQTGGRPALEDTSGGGRAVAPPDGRGIGPGGRRRAAEPNEGSLESQVADGRFDGIASNHVSSAAAGQPRGQLRSRLDALGPAPRAELLHVLTLPDFERADRIGEFLGYPQSPTFAELRIDCEENRVLRAVLVGMLREVDRQPRP